MEHIPILFQNDYSAECLSGDADIKYDNQIYIDPDEDKLIIPNGGKIGTISREML